MSRFLLFGASRGLGLAITRHLLAQEHEVHALVRSQAQAVELEAMGVRVTQGDALDGEAVALACAGAGEEALTISTLGSFRAERPVDFEGNRLVIDTLEQCGLRRLLLITSLGCGDSWHSLPERARAVFGQEVRLKSLAESWLQSSSLAWTILRPAGLQDGEPTGHARLAPQGEELHGLVRRSDVARLAHTLVQDPQHIGRIYGCVDDALIRAS
ncbi:SDR family oxidoreductase [Aeromonas schubertii]|uniref:SDR family oxidoreductase n=1 Tax=Aeromonas schubertii TaxID=652 RepID=UPI001CC4F080|nr:SDR family oxidoreductase [Aeromonas schubertii]MBZ6074391.1 SDR family oxidoreductase [Aeromonas schubertii]